MNDKEFRFTLITHSKGRNSTWWQENFQTNIFKMRDSFLWLKKNNFKFTYKENTVFSSTYSSQFNVKNFCVDLIPEI